MSIIKPISAILIFASIFLFTSTTKAQNLPFSGGSFAGNMLVYKNNRIVDSVPALLSITSILPDSVWQWKTEYLSTKMPVTKDYKLTFADRSKGIFITDEGNGVILYDYLFGNKLYSQFETGGFLLTSSYEFINDDEIIFEVTAGKKNLEKSSDEVAIFQVNTLQKTVFKRKK